MPPLLSRRSCLIGGLTVAAALPGLPAEAQDREKAIIDRIADLERQRGGRLGVAILDMATTQTIAYRAKERFPLCSTYKLIAAAFALSRVDRSEERLDRRISYDRSALVPYSPVTQKHADLEGMTVGELCDAAVTLSDNTAGNLLFDSFGGPAALTGYLRSLGDNVTRFDRYEPSLNTALSDDPRDTTTPNAMAELVRKFLFLPTLSPSSRDLLTAWIVGCKTGATRLRGGVPAGWRAGDKTGAGENNSTNDVAVFWPPARSPMIVAAYYTGSATTSDERNAVLLEVGRLAATI